jgi:hypothetical protein
VSSASTGVLDCVHVHECTCSFGMVSRYQKRISGPLLDRIDIHIEVPREEHDTLSDEQPRWLRRSAFRYPRPILAPGNCSLPLAPTYAILSQYRPPQNRRHSMTWSLGWIGNGRIVTGRVLTDIEFETYDDAASRLNTLWDDQALFALVLHNYQAYNDYLAQLSKAWMNPGSAGPSDPVAGTMHLNRHILNYLSSVRTFLDHTELRLKRRYGRESKTVTSFTEACARGYDNHFSYRFLYRLRNYVQHCGLPVGHVGGSAEVTDLDSWKIQRSLVINFVRDRLLLERSCWGATLADEIRRLPSEFPIHPHMSRMMACLNTINLVPISDNMPDLLKATGFIEELVSSIEDCKGTPCLLQERERDTSGPIIPLSVRSIPFEAMELVRMLETAPTTG